MAELLLFLILASVFKSVIKQKKQSGTKQEQAQNRVEKRKATAEEIRQRAQRAIRMYDEMQKRDAAKSAKAQQTSMLDMHTHEHAEGESCPQPEFSGSMQFDSNEGECLCDPVLEHEDTNTVETTGVYANQIGQEPMIDFSTRGLLQGVVMSEVLKRPSQRWHR